jgi:hypothetical protein
MLHFVGIGAQKAGTTWLFEKLRQHPCISFPAGKEVHFWDKHRHRGVDWYRRLFEVDDGRLHGEVTPAYSILPRETVGQVRRAFPSLRTILIIRNPLERAWSAAKMSLAREGIPIDEAPDERFLREFHEPSSIARGDYEACIRCWRSEYPPERLLVLRFERVSSDPIGVLRDCCRHLGVDDTAFPAGIERGARVFPGPPDPLRPSLLPALRSLYEHRIRSLAAYLGEDLGAWLDDGPGRPTLAPGTMPW